MLNLSYHMNQGQQYAREAFRRSGSVTLFARWRKDHRDVRTEVDQQTSVHFSDIRPVINTDSAVYLEQRQLNHAAIIVAAGLAEAT